MGIEVGGLLGLLWLIVVIWAVIHIAQSSSSVGAKALWIAVVLIFPLVGLLIWLVFGPRAAKT